MQESLQNLTALIVVQCSEVDHTKLHTGYICRLCVALLEKYHSTLKNLGARLTTALPILPKTLSINPLPAPISAPLEAQVWLQEARLQQAPISGSNSKKIIHVGIR